MSGAPARIPVRAAGGRDYEVVVGRGEAGRVGEHSRAAAPGVRRWAVLSDETVAGLHGAGVVRSLERAGLGAGLVTFPAGEAHKTRATWSHLTDRLLEEGHGRDSGVVALGGGVTGDLAGFVAATFLRGVPVLQLPSSVVAMVDSAVGGKTGVDTPLGKNLVGAFHPPVRVVADPELLRTLPRDQRSEGLAEAVKHGALVDADYARGLARDAQALLSGEGGDWASVVLRSVEVKVDVVSRDEREAGRREILNFGHTLGHALEAASDYRLSHGQAVSIGMVLEARLGEALGRTRAGTARELASILTAVELPVAPPAGLDVERVVGFTRVDKKVRAGRARYVFLDALGAVRGGEAGWAEAVDDEAVRDLLGSP